MKNLFCFITFNIVITSRLLAADYISSIPANLEWQYCLEYGYLHEKNCLQLSSFSIVTTKDPKYPFAWEHETDTSYEQTNSNDNWKYVGHTEKKEIEAYLREKDGKVYVALESFKIPEGELYEWYMCQKELSFFNQMSQNIETYAAKPGEEVILYDFSAKVGDQYRSIIFGSIICDVIVTKITENDNLFENHETSIAKKIIEVLPVFAESMIGSNIDMDKFTIKYAQQIGNIYMGNYIYLFTEPYVLPDNGYEASYVINNIYKNGMLFFKGRDFSESTGLIQNISVDETTNLLYDLHGREVSNPLPGSIYIRNGKKFVAK